MLSILVGWRNYVRRLVLVVDDPGKKNRTYHFGLACSSGVLVALLVRGDSVWPVDRDDGVDEGGGGGRKER